MQTTQNILGLVGPGRKSLIWSSAAYRTSSPCFASKVPCCLSLFMSSGFNNFRSNRTPKCWMTSTSSLRVYWCSLLPNASVRWLFFTACFVNAILPLAVASFRGLIFVELVRKSDNRLIVCDPKSNTSLLDEAVWLIDQIEFARTFLMVRKKFTWVWLEYEPISLLEIISTCLKFQVCTRNPPLEIQGPG